MQVAALLAGSGWIDLEEATFRTRDGLWSSPEALVLHGASNPELAIGPGGDALLLWEASTAQGERLHGAFLASGAPAWQQFTPTASGGPAARPTQLVAGDDGLFALTWVDGPALLGALYQVGDGDLLDGYARLGPARVLSDATDALWAGGRALVATNYAGGLLDVYHTEGDRFWPGAKAIARVGDGSRFHGPLLLGDGTTSARALWLQSAGPGGARMPLSVSAATLFYSGDWSEPEELAALDPSAGVRSLTGAGSESGLALLAWENAASEASGGAVAPSAVSAGSHLGLLVLAADGGASASRPDAIDVLGNAYRPAVAVSAEGDAVVTWVASGGSDSDVDAATAVWGASRRPGDALWSPPVPLSDPAASARAPALALAPDGAGHAAWVEIDAQGGARLVAARFTADGGFSAPSELTSSATPAAPAYASPLAADVDSGPRIAVDRQGRARVVWISTAGGLWYSQHD